MRHRCEKLGEGFSLFFSLPFFLTTVPASHWPGSNGPGCKIVERKEGRSGGILNVPVSKLRHLLTISQVTTDSLSGKGDRTELRNYPPRKRLAHGELG